MTYFQVKCRSQACASSTTIGISRPTERGGGGGGGGGGGQPGRRPGAHKPNEGKKTRVYLEQGKQNKMCTFVNM
jgi:hypothetical protein